MPYDRNGDLPGSVRSHLPARAQKIYREAFNAAFEQYKNRANGEVIAHKVAWSAVKKKYHKTEDGSWKPLS